MSFSPRSALSFVAGTLFFLTACNNSETSKTDATATDSSANTSATPVTPASTTITTPQNMVVIRHKVKNFNTWKMAYDAHDSARVAAGLHNYVVSRGLEDTSTVMVALKADDMAKAKAFANDPGLKTAMQKGGVLGTPSIQFVVMTFQDTAHINSTIRSVTWFNVKDWAAWETGFKQGEQERIDNGIALRAYGHSADDDKKVSVVTAIMDTAKAQAYWKSDMLKKRREASGVTSTPERFVYTVVQRY
jgi:hypothetical protein